MTPHHPDPLVPKEIDNSKWRIDVGDVCIPAAGAASIPAGYVAGGEINWQAAPFADDGWGGRLTAAAHAYLADYVWSPDEGSDYTPNSWERSLIEDFVAGLFVDDAFDGVLRRMAFGANALQQVRTYVATVRAPSPATVMDACDKALLAMSNGAKATTAPSMGDGDE